VDYANTHAISSDCVETTVRNFLNVYFWNPARQLFSFDHLPALGITVHEKVKGFYQSIGNVRCVKSPSPIAG